MIQLQMMWQRFKLTRLYQRLIGDSAEKVWLAALWSALLAAILYLSFQFYDTDLYYIIPTGRYILENGIPYENPFIVTQGQNIVVQNWLYCAITAWIYNSLHSTGLWLFQLITILGMVAVIFAFFGFKKSDNKPMIGIFTLMSLALFGYINLRPEMLTFILVMLEIIGVERYRDTGKMRYLWLLPLTMLIEINCHASYWIMHFIVLLPYCVPALFSKLMRVEDTHIPNHMTGKMVIPLLVMVDMLFVNPYGFDAVTYVFDALSSNVISLSGITEQQPFTINSMYAWAYILALFVFLVMWWKKKLTSTDFYMYIGFSITFVMAVKWLPFYVISLIFLFRAMYRQTEGRDGYKISKLKVPVFCSVLIVIMVCMVFGTLFKNNNIGACFDASTDEYLDHAAVQGTAYESFAEMADYLDENDPDASVFAIFEQSNYFEYRGYKIFTDARPEIYTEEIAGSDELTSMLFKIHDAVDELGYNDALVAASSFASTTDKDAIDISDYCLTAAEYADVVDNIETEYYVACTTSAILYHYLDNNPDKYTCVVDSGQYKLYQKHIVNP